MSLERYPKQTVICRHALALCVFKESLTVQLLLPLFIPDTLGCSVPHFTQDCFSANYLSVKTLTHPGRFYNKKVLKRVILTLFFTLKMFCLLSKRLSQSFVYQILMYFRTTLAKCNIVGVWQYLWRNIKLKNDQ